MKNTWRLIYLSIPLTAIVFAGMLWRNEMKAATEDIPFPAEVTEAVPAVRRYTAPAEVYAEDAEETAEIVMRRYTEDEGPAPEWWKPNEPMAAVWTEVSDNFFDNSVDKTVDDKTETVDAASYEQVTKGNKEADSGEVFGGAEQVEYQENQENQENSNEILTTIQQEPCVTQSEYAIDAGCPDYDFEPEAVPDWLLDVPLDRYLQEYIHGLCEDSGLPYTLAVAVIEQESHYMPRVISDSDDWGLMQINAVCHGWLSDELGITDFLDPWQNARAGVYLLGTYYRDFGYESGTLMAYNMGREAAEQLFRQGIYATDYSERVMGIRERLEREGR